MSGYTNAVTNITDESQYYVYPMAASLRGGAVESEYNIRNLMTCLFNKSAAKQDEDFIVYYNREIDKENGRQKPTLETYYDNTSWYSIDLEKGICNIKDLAVSPGEGNCNGYYVRLQDFTPINNTALNIQNLIHSHTGYTPVIPADLAPTAPVAKTIFDSLDALKAAETAGEIGSGSYKEETSEGTVVEYVEDGRYKSGVTVRIKLNPGSATYNYICYVKDKHNNWQLASDMVAEYENTADGQKISKYRIYTNGKYFYKNAAGDIEILSFKDSSGNDQTNLKYDAINDVDYLELPSDTQLYKINVGYQKFNIVLGLNWTVNQLVSSAQITICEDTTPIKYITEEDLDGDKTQYAYTEYGFLNKTLRDRGLLDAGILLGTIKVKKTPIHSIINDKAEYTYEYTCIYEGNRYKTACIDLDKLGTDTDMLGENMYDKIMRLFNLMIDSGSFKIGTVIKHSGFDPNPDSVNHDFVKGIAPYRLDLGITDFESGVGQTHINGYLRFINYNEEFNSASECPDGYIFKCRVKVNQVTGQAEALESLTLYNDAIECFDSMIRFNKNLYVGSSTNKKNLYVSGTTEITGKLTAKSNVDITGTLDVGGNIHTDSNIIADGNLSLNNKITFTANSATLYANADNLCTDKLRVNKRFIVQDTGGQTINVQSGSASGDRLFLVTTDCLQINSDNGIIWAESKLKTNDLVDAARVHASGEIRAPKVYGAVWM